MLRLIVRSVVWCNDSYTIAAGDRSKHCRSVAPWPNRNEVTPYRTISGSYDWLRLDQGATDRQWTDRFISKAPVTPGLRPGYDLPATEKWANRRKNVRLVAEVVRLVAEVVGDRKGQISRNKVVVMFKTRSHRAYDQVTTYLRSKNVGMMGQS